MTVPRRGLVFPTKGGPPPAKPLLVRWFVCRQQESSHLGHREWNVAHASPPFSPTARSWVVAWSRVTSSTACAASARVIKRYQAS